MATTKMPSSLEIAQAGELRPIADVAEEIGLERRRGRVYGRFKAKVDLAVLDRLGTGPDAKLVCVTAITPTPAGEGKTTTAISLTQGLGASASARCSACASRRSARCSAIKGGAAGGGRAQVVPMEDINLHFTGDIHAIGAANNLLAAMLDAHILHGNELGIDPLAITLAALPRHERPRAAHDRRRPRRPRERLRRARPASTSPPPPR